MRRKFDRHILYTGLMGLAAGFLVLGSSAHAGDARLEQDSRQAFKAFASPLVGNWDCSLRTWEDRFHERMVETSQKRRFSWVLGGHFLQESVYAVLRRGELMHVGINLLSVDPTNTHVLVSGFAAGTPDRKVSLDGELAPDFRHLSGRLTVVPRNPEADPQRLEWRWLDDGRTSSRMYARASNGREFLHQELVCRRAQEETAAANQ
ncbi:hypothetical protein [Tahibacter amnicola]|uniref:Uncharacterized protein n=1 Tax=Tahibacter amnicola TaxID=2976241 RepID=A0ABY6BI38_9GAMM|nr:hypothetical protein [Tahibacter amnicola]UXI69524.1 hypothetical protein N4264_07735 [Tahibacter amnicola]